MNRQKQQINGRKTNVWGKYGGQLKKGIPDIQRNYLYLVLRCGKQKGE
jgi:hypothetical protein